MFLIILLWVWWSLCVCFSATVDIDQICSYLFVYVYRLISGERKCWVKACRAFRPQNVESGWWGSCVTHVLGVLSMHKSAVACTWILVGTIVSCTLADRGHGISYKGLVYPGIRLHVRGHDLGMLSKVPFEGFTLPSSFGFDYIKGNPLE